ATNVDLLEAVMKGKFREDLYYRLSGITIRIPPLRERGDDIIELFRHFSLNTATKYEIPPLKLDDKASQMLLEYSWPGNVRQLKNLAESLTILVEDRNITKEILKNHPPFNRKETLPRQNEDDLAFKNIAPFLLQLYGSMKNDIDKIMDALRDAGIHIDINIEKRKELLQNKNVQDVVGEEIKE
ncbi:MAG: sigma 54-interacting transcriptional regulator, partial [Bacteroidaceae bacterium]|nr:sigma 54-interacting transcriptional regulator [Bacteroidaceae bacterium]